MDGRTVDWIHMKTYGIAQIARFKRHLFNPNFAVTLDTKRDSTFRIERRSFEHIRFEYIDAFYQDLARCARIGNQSSSPGFVCQVLAELTTLSKVETE
jgi:hypothetical protein